MHVCHDIPIGGRVRLGGDGRTSSIFRVFFFLVIEDHLVVINNNDGVTIFSLVIVM